MEINTNKQVAFGAIKLPYRTTKPNILKSFDRAFGPSANIMTSCKNNRNFLFYSQEVENEAIEFLKTQNVPKYVHYNDEHMTMKQFEDFCNFDIEG